MQLSVVIPVYQSAALAPELYERLTTTLSGSGYSYELIIVDDCSSDGAFGFWENVAQSDDHVLAIQLMKRSGQQRAVLCGLSLAVGEIVVTMDDDLQHSPEDIPLLVEALADPDLDVAVGKFAVKKHGWLRNLGTSLVRWLSFSALGVPKSLELTSFRAVRQVVAREVVRLRNPQPVVGYLLWMVTHRFRNVRVQHAPRPGSASSYSLGRLVSYFWLMLLDYSDIPLRLLGVLGMMLAGGSFLLTATYLVSYFLGQITVSGFVTIVLLLTFLSGCILLALSVIGAYLRRVMLSVDSVPVFVIRRNTRSSSLNS